ncbi:EcsC family protein [Evansella cellulosilytica]|uniref:EcsC family protein n=1 Tax=Evansella cellulosilytica (strain ATCC 21833 / DSM 2522 / FERM P-1141 / JCM 9156 / N-4) TaxID=649639 RepID=E6TV54_EVAC2|nr:EcsC family protein [Evansella cellulosilytica]ADU29738.1 hypothetical protein Bcell_1475 [Evansella cellulosilytica DSM 2522]
MTYIDKVERELDRWERRIKRPPSVTSKLTKGWQNKINAKIPERFHQTVAESVKQMVKATLFGSDYFSDQKVMTNLTLEERERELEKVIEKYKRTAALEGAGTGAGGILLGMADFPLLLSIKMKFLFDSAKIYGHDVSDYRERLFLLSIFQLAFSKEEKKLAALKRIKNWKATFKQLPEEKGHLNSIDWKTFQLEYRDFIDLPKMMQLIPGFGAIVGAIANYKFLDLLADHAKNSFRYRMLR